jgi:hypothetical protein
LILAFSGYSAIPTIVFAVPAYFVGRWLNLIRWWSTLIVGFVIGLLVWIIFVWPQLVHPSPTATAFDLIKGGLTWAAVGAIAGIAFWLSWVRGHPSTP